MLQYKGGQLLRAGSRGPGLGGTVRSVHPIVQYKHFIPVQKHRNTIGFNIQGSFLTGYDGVVASPFQRFYMGGEHDLRAFDTPLRFSVAYLPSAGEIVLRNPDGPVVLKDPSDPCGAPGNGSKSHRSDRVPRWRRKFVGNLEYRITIAGPVAVAPFIDTGNDAIFRNSQLNIRPEQLRTLEHTRFGCPELNVAFKSMGPEVPIRCLLLGSAGRTNWIPRCRRDWSCRYSCRSSTLRSESTGHITLCV